MPSLYQEHHLNTSASSSSNTTTESQKYLRYFESSAGSLVENEFNKNPRKTSDMGSLAKVGMRSPMSYLRILELQRRQNSNALKEYAWQGA
ncbi:unnamed protein product [Bursaphelenchus okinawaensis]|uniref:Uncharacterized protein n=1 Tax=Bursaphelenchus okinawaensis TaxID=465554 RepID=A0A811LM84_9BILA|nr:unnamed protein product [Bursaphelenchus okinawaensis]CAG9125064.1 unnamed protein product [Bursaphelenchus okinawaensis]